MANRLKMADVQSILLLHSQGWSRGRVARELGVDRETVSRYVQLDQQSSTAIQHDGGISKLANAPISGPGSPASVEPPIAPIESTGPASGYPGRRSDCRRFDRREPARRRSCCCRSRPVAPKFNFAQPWRADSRVDAATKGQRRGRIERMRDVHPSTDAGESVQPALFSSVYRWQSLSAEERLCGRRAPIRLQIQSANRPMSARWSTNLTEGGVSSVTNAMIDLSRVANGGVPRLLRHTSIFGAVVCESPSTNTSRHSWKMRANAA